VIDDQFELETAGAAELGVFTVVLLRSRGLRTACRGAATRTTGPHRTSGSHRTTTSATHRRTAAAHRTAATAAHRTAAVLVGLAAGNQHTAEFLGECKIDRDTELVT
jgi:hypothetical protein